jgi:hypothetical protein
VRKSLVFANFCFLAIIIALSFSSCKKEDSQIGLNVQPGGDRIFIEHDSLAIFRSYIDLDDSVSSINLSYNLLGAYSDDVFGKTKSEIITQLELPSDNVNFSNQVEGSALYANSMKLYLDFIDFYGKGTEPLNIIVYEINEILYDSLTYYSNYSFTETYEQIGSVSFLPEFDGDNNFVDTVIEIDLDLSFATKLLEADTMHYIDNQAFKQFFKGLYIVVEDVQNGGLLTCNLLSSVSETKMTLNYNDSLSFNYLISANAIRFNRFLHDYNEGEFGPMIDDVPDSLLFVQSGGGTHARISFDNYQHWKDSSIAVLKAEMIIPVSENYYASSTFFKPVERLLFSIDQGDGTFAFSYDYLLSQNAGQETYFNGYFDEANMQYRFNITRYFQSLINGEEQNNTIKLFPLSTKIKANKVVLENGYNNLIKLSLTYTKL